MFAVVCVLVIVDIIYLTVWQVTDPMTRTVREFPQEVRPLEGFSWSVKTKLVSHRHATRLALKCRVTFLSNKSKSKLNRYSLTYVFCASRKVDVITSSFDWSTVLSLSFPIGVIITLGLVLVYNMHALN